MSLEAVECEAAAPARVAAAVDSHPEGHDAAVLAATIARATGADLLLVAIEPDLRLVVPGADWKRRRCETESMLTATRDSFAKGARLMVDSDRSVPRGIERAVSSSDRDLLVVGSSRRGEVGQVSIGKYTRQLLHDLRCALAVAPRGLSQRSELELRRIAVGYDGSPEARAALATATAIAIGCGARLLVRGVVDDRIPALGWRQSWRDSLVDSWHEMMEGETRTLKEQIDTTCARLTVAPEIDVQNGRPATSLLELAADTDLLAIGSRRWGPVARVLLGGTGEALAHGASCSLLVVPRPAR